MTARLDLIAHGATAATRAARFPDDEALEASAVGGLEALRGRLRSDQRALAAPARAALETAVALGLDPHVETAIRDCDYGRWRGRTLTDISARDPEGFAAWLRDPAAAPHGGELLTALIERAGAWLAQCLARDSATVAVTHASFVRAAIVSTFGAPASAFWRIDVAPLGLARLSGREGRWNLVALRALDAQA